MRARNAFFAAPESLPFFAGRFFAGRFFAARFAARFFGAELRRAARFFFARFFARFFAGSAVRSTRCFPFTVTIRSAMLPPHTYVAEIEI